MVVKNSSLAANWQALVGLGPRLTGSETSSAAAELVTELLTKADGRLAPTLHHFHIPGWSESSEPDLVVKLPNQELVQCRTCLWSPPTRRPCATGLLRPGGTLQLLGFEWHDFPLADDEGNVVAHVLGRDQGPAIPIPVPVEVDSIPPRDPMPSTPYVVCGEEVTGRIRERLARNQRVPARLKVATRTGIAWEGHNVTDETAFSAFPRSVVVLCAHYDTTIACPGADDNASGVAALVLLADRLKDRRDIVYAFFGAEEWNMWGSRSYVHRLMADGLLGRIRYVLNIDGISDGSGLVVRAEQGDFREVVRRIVDTGEVGGQDPLHVEAMPPGVGDHWPFFLQGIPCIWLTREGKRNYHLTADTYKLDDLANIEAALSVAARIVEDL